jgi:hypothetical protein
MSNIRIIRLEGSKHEMGVEYGKQLVLEMRASLDILYKFFIEENNISLERLVEKADQFYQRYPLGYQKFIQGISEGSGLSLDEVKILNGMETLYVLKNEKQELGACAFVSIPPNSSNYNIIGRNYDFPAPYNEIAKYLTVTILKEPDTVPTAIIALPGQIYGATCINANSLFIALNNGMPSGGFEVNDNVQSMLITLLETIQNSSNFSQMDKLLLSHNSDYSLIINTADQNHVKSYEYSSFKGNRSYMPEEKKVFVSTNFYQDNSWKNIEKATDKSSWLGISRRDNLLNSAKKESTIEEVKNLFDLKYIDGGAKLDRTIYQAIFDTKSQELYLKIAQEDLEWTCINNLFNSSNDI